METLLNRFRFDTFLTHVCPRSTQDSTLSSASIISTTAVFVDDDDVEFARWRYWLFARRRHQFLVVVETVLVLVEPVGDPPHRPPLAVGAVPVPVPAVARTAPRRRRRRGGTRPFAVRRRLADVRWRKAAAAERRLECGIVADRRTPQTVAATVVATGRRTLSTIHTTANTHTHTHRINRIKYDFTNCWQTATWLQIAKHVIK